MTADSVVDAARFVLVADGGCGPCSTLGREVAGLADLAVISTARAEALGWTEPGQPGPLLVQARGDVPLARWYGWGMRLRLARLLGVRRSKHWLRLLHAEYEAHDQRHGLGVSRRTVVLGALAGLVAAGASTQVAVADPGSSPAEYEPLDAAATADLLEGSLAAREVTDRLGAVEYGKLTGDGGEVTFVVRHSEDSATVVPANAREVGVTFTLKDQGSTISMSLHTGDELISYVGLRTKPRAVVPRRSVPQGPTAVSAYLPLDPMVAPQGSLTAPPMPGIEPFVVQPVGVNEFVDCLLREGWQNADALANCLDKCTAGALWCIACLGPSAAKSVYKCWPQAFK